MTMNVDDAWNELFKKYNILAEINKNGFFKISADQIREYKEPRLMAKWDSSEKLPKPFSKYSINILPISRGEYILGKFKLYSPIPELGEKETEMQKVEVPHYETIDIENITSEANAINVLMISKILDDFLGEDSNVATFNGRMGTGKFSFWVDTSAQPLNIDVKNAQCEIDAGMENINSVVILEAKNVIHPDFHIRQLYYPYRLWETKVTKPIRLVFSIYYNQIFRLFEYAFKEKDNYSSIYLVREKNYSLQDTNISMEDLYQTFKKTEVLYNDQKSRSVPFIQANSFERVISLLEIINRKARTSKEIADIMEFDIRQSGYYYNAGKYLNLFEKDWEKNTDKDGKIRKEKKVFLTDIGKTLIKMKYKERQLTLVKLILQHKIFNVLFKETYDTGKLPTAERIKSLMVELDVCNKGQIQRRSSSVYSWLRWIIYLTKI